MHKGYGETEEGIRTSLHECETCGVDFTLCPAVGPAEPGWENCLTDDCSSYDAHRDMDILYMTAAEIAKDKRIVSIVQLRKWRTAQEI